MSRAARLEPWLCPANLRRPPRPGPPRPRARLGKAPRDRAAPPPPGRGCSARPWAGTIARLPASVSIAAASSRLRRCSPSTAAAPRPAGLTATLGLEVTSSRTGNRAIRSARRPSSSSVEGSAQWTSSHRNSTGPCAAIPRAGRAMSRASAPCAAAASAPRGGHGHAGVWRADRPVPRQPRRPFRRPESALLPASRADRAEVFADLEPSRSLEHPSHRKQHGVGEERRAEQRHGPVPDAASRLRSARTRRDLPIPASPTSSTTRPLPASACRQ